MIKMRSEDTPSRSAADENNDLHYNITEVYNIVSHIGQLKGGGRGHSKAISNDNLRELGLEKYKIVKSRPAGKQKELYPESGVYEFLQELEEEGIVEPLESHGIKSPEDISSTGYHKGKFKLPTYRAKKSVTTLREQLENFGPKRVGSTGKHRTYNPGSPDPAIENLVRALEEAPRKLERRK